MTADKRRNLDEYYRKRSADVTREPFGRAPEAPDEPRSLPFVVHKHAATRLHHDLRLEWGGVLLSWAVPRGPSRDPKEKRLAVETEPHPVEYADFEGVIPKGNYGAGAMILWDRGRWIPLEDPDHGLEKGKLLFELRGYKLRGVYTLVRTGRSNSKDWLLIKKPDAWMASEDETEWDDTSILSGLTIADLESGNRRAEGIRRELETLGAPREPVDIAQTRPMLAGRHSEPFDDPKWLFELKYDGFRVLAARDAHGRARLFYRSGREATHIYPDLARVLAAQPFDNLILDAEVVVLDDDAKPDFGRLQKRAMLSRKLDIDQATVNLPATLFVFDLLAFEDFDLRPLPLTQRKALLQQVLPSAGPLKYADHIETIGKAMFDQVVRMGLEGVMAKRADSRYVDGRSENWLKVPADRTGDFAVVGYTRPKGLRKGIGALLLAYQEEGELVYCGRVGTGFSHDQLVEFRERLEPARLKEPPCTGNLPRGADTHWVDPEWVAEVRFKTMTGDGQLRHPVFVRLRDDKPVDACRLELPHHELPPEPEVEEQATGEREVKLTNQDKVFWPDDGYTKGDLVDFYVAVAPWLLPYLDERPVVLTRFPDGIDGKSFYQKDAPDFLPAWVRRERMWSNHAEREIDYLVVDCPETLAYIGNMASIPLHVWSSRMPTLQQPDWCVIDLDPKGAPFEDVVRIALAIRALCEEIQLPCYVKTSGSTGLHVMLPLGARFTYEQSRMLAMLIAQAVLIDLDDIATVARSLRSREGKVYIDTGQNGHGRLIVSPYSVRPKPGAPVSTPLTWDEVTPDLRIGDYTIRTVLDRLRSQDADPLLPVLTEKPDLPRALGLLAAKLQG